MEAMKDYVVHPRSSNSNSITTSSTIDILSFLTNETRTSDADGSEIENDDLPDSNDVFVNATRTSSTSNNQTTFDDEESDECDLDESIDRTSRQHTTTSNSKESNEDSNDDLNSTSLRNNSNSTNQSSRANTSSVPPKQNPRIRAERQFGEVITSGTLLQDLRKKAEAKASKVSKQKNVQQSSRSTRQKLN
ncbi:unnamed protein product [Rotaria sp. Silwood2]|nr:unnamed protein product [Rotaria sp. Silwood2]CAF4625527.1 unnamed protein product [Rotaria sp. Silwood2]CAF4638865.1 unnamed protein product [Rotaria sp. Silwood2]CAF4768608.1 unnamed protein product [Rotaria sp. Silwood2]